MTEEVIFTLAFLPLYLLLREPFCRLPLHIDTGFYVSNHTIATRRLAFSQGWNAHHAGCSKLIPELFYSIIYLLHSRPGGSGGAQGPLGYKQMSRRYATLLNFITAVTVGALACALADGNSAYYYAGLIAFAVLSSEPHYGVYFECAEWFEMPAHVGGLLCLLVGIACSGPWWIFAGAFVWAADAFFVKLSSGITFAILLGGLAVAYPWITLPAAAGGLLAGALFLGWVVSNGAGFRTLLRSLWGHEVNFGQGADPKRLLYRFREKGWCLWRVVARQPILPALALAGIVFGPRLPLIFWLYLIGVGVAYVAQAADCRYYLIPLLPPVALLATEGIVVLADGGFFGVAILVAGGIAWAVHNPLRAARLDAERLNRWCWQGFRPAAEITRNLALEHAAQELEPVVAGRPLLVYGPFNQLYVLLNASYVTPIVTPELYLDDVCPGWQAALNERLVAEPPPFVLDTSEVFAAPVARQRLGLDYRLTQVFGTAFRLYELTGVSPAREDFRAAPTYRPQSRSQLEAEERRAGGELIVHGDRIYGGMATEPALDDRPTAKLGALLKELQRRGHRGLALYGAGRFTIRHAELYRNSTVPVTVVLDDNAQRFDGTFLDWPVRTPDEAAEFSFDAIVVSSDRFSRPMLTQIRHRFGESIPAYAALG